MKKEYKTPVSHVIIMKVTAPLLGSITNTYYGFDGSYNDEYVDDGN